MRQKSHSDSGLGQHHFSTLDTDMEQENPWELKTLTEAQEVIEELFEDHKNLTSFLANHDPEKFFREDKERRMLRHRAIEAMIMLKYRLPQHTIEETE